MSLQWRLVYLEISAVERKGLMGQDNFAGSLAVHNFAVAVECAAGYIGTPKVGKARGCRSSRILSGDRVAYQSLDVS